MEDIVKRSQVRKINDGAEKDGFLQYIYILDIEKEVNIKEGINNGKRNKEGLIPFIA